MNRVAMVIGYVFIVLWLLGVLNVIDFHICIKDAGKCKNVQHGKGEVSK